MNSKRIVTFAALAALAGRVALVATATAAEPISGIYNTSAGYLAGKDASGRRVTAVGAGAAGALEDGYNSVFLGSLSGAWSRNLTDCAAYGDAAMSYSTNNQNCVAIGAGAMKRAAGCANCVAIGPNAMLNAQNRRNCVDLNGMFVADGDNGTLAIRAGTNVNDTVMGYSNGLLSFYPSVSFSGPTYFVGMTINENGSVSFHSGEVAFADYTDVIVHAAKFNVFFPGSQTATTLSDLLSTYVKFENGALNVYTNGVCVGSLSLSPPATP